jgi:RNA recognition motif-containing protein
MLEGNALQVEFCAPMVEPASNKQQVSTKPVKQLRVAPGASIFVANLGFTCTEETIRYFFEQAGPV